MAEETPGNLTGMFGGFVAGRAAGNRRLEESVDRLEETINKFSDALSRLTSSLDAQARTAGAAASGGATTQGQTRMGNGGNVSFGGGGAHVGSPAGSHRASGFPTIGGSGGGGGRISNGGIQSHSGGWGFGPQGAARGMYNRAGGAGGIAGRAAGGVAAGVGVYTANHYSNQVMGQSIAAQYSYGSNWSQAYRGGLTGNYTAASDQDFFAASNMMASQSGMALGGGGYREMMAGVGSVSFADPTITNQQAAQGTLALGGVGTFNRMQGLGITTMGRNGQINPNSVARQILQRMGSGRVRTAEQAEAAFGPSGSATVTLNDMVRNGFVPPESVPAVRAAMRGILKAQVGGMGYREYNRLTRTAATNANGSAGDAARDRLQEVGIGNTMIQQERQRAGLSRDSEAETISGFTKGVSAATNALANFRGALNRILQIPGVGEAVGGASGLFGTAPGISGIISRFTPFGGDGPSNMGSSATSYAGAAGLAIGGSGNPSMSASAAMYAGAAGVSGRRGAAGGSANTNRYSLGAVKPWVARAANVLGPKFGIKSIGGYRSSSAVSNSDHPKGLALDFMCGKSAGDGLAAYAVANHKQLNITYVIWRQRIWSINNRSWKRMEDRGSITANHYDHVHISFLANPSNPDVGGLPAGGNTGNAVGGALGAGASNADNGSSAAFASATSGSGTGFGGYSEVAALGLGGGGVGGGVGLGSGGLGTGGTGSPSGGSGSSVGAAGGGSLAVGGLNVFRKASLKQQAADLGRMMGGADVLGLSEVHGGGLLRWAREQGWGAFKASGRGADTALTWDKSKYDLVSRGSQKLNDTEGPTGGMRSRYAAYGLFKDKRTGTQHWQISAHLTPPNQGPAHLRNKIRAEQMAALDALENRLGRTAPVVLVGDLNMRNARIPGMKSAGFGGINHILTSGGRFTGTDLVGGLNTDHNGVLASLAFGGSGGLGSGGNGGGPAANMRLGQAMAAQRGWSGAQWNALKQLWMRESGWRTNADNPTSSAYGIPQALTELHGLGEKYKTDPRAQIKWGLNYIAGRYGNPANAWDFWRKNHWYDKGAWNLQEDHDARVHKGEMILPAEIASAVRSELSSPTRGRTGGPSIVFQPGAIQVSLGGGSVSEKQAKVAGQQIVDAMMEDARFKALAEG